MSPITQFHCLHCLVLPTYVLVYSLGGGSRFQESQVMTLWFDSLISAFVMSPSLFGPRRIICSSQSLKNGG